jgi:hypothetical protein
MRPDSECLGKQRRAKPLWSTFGLTGLGQAEVICLQNKAWRRDMAGSAPPGHGKEDSVAPTQRSAAGKAAGIVSQVKPEPL